MLAYVFWHWPQARVDRDEYVDHLIDFQRTLAANKPDGFRESAVFRIRGASWLKTQGEAYEEWYLLDDSAAMDRLNDGAVSGACLEPHNRVARDAADGTGGLYRFRRGDEELGRSRFSVWLSKPSSVTYKDFYEGLESLTSQPGVGLWGRQMTLGPTTEFCIHSPTSLKLPEGYSDERVPLELMWAR